MKIKAVRLFETCVTAGQLTDRSIAGNSNLQKHCSEKLRSQNLCFDWSSLNDRGTENSIFPKLIETPEQERLRLMIQDEFAVW